jgi:hypothetical protein
MIRALRTALLSLCLIITSAAQAAPAADTPELRRQAAEQLFQLPAYRQVASRQIYEAARSLPDGQYQSAVEALSEPKVVQALRAVIVRSMAQTFSVAEMESLGRYLATEEARSTVEKTEAFQGTLVREFLKEGLTNPELARMLAPR